ncbi:hypothetical protein NSK_007196 [Nannochloropsis salina CCMP1776]|uniref:Uncharacterized protein n=1 Tax=Nannochloropsis salina CCMP1776 TaxID=1027361 RepID=A0A4D9CSH2_9STRA|nr:hypothetical protein NSK_007196 [Nannochloropsis salina CCMP1776]|eukprot:TFJ81474.1 hypothetical protein NSK_007196 [Nannochloropsis salina CCMP1776]
MNPYGQHQQQQMFYGQPPQQQQQQQPYGAGGYAHPQQQQYPPQAPSQAYGGYMQQPQQATGYPPQQAYPPQAQPQQFSPAQIPAQPSYQPQPVPQVQEPQYSQIPPAAGSSALPTQVTAGPGGDMSMETQHEDMIHDAQLDYYGKKLATCSSDRTIKVLDRQRAGRLIRRPEGGAFQATFERGVGAVGRNRGRGEGWKPVDAVAEAPVSAAGGAL